MGKILRWGGRALSGSSGLLAVVFFFMPWLLASCGGQEIGSVSGWELARGFSMGGQTNGGNPWLFVILIFGVLAIIVAAVPWRKTGWLGGIEAGLALTGLMVLLLVVIGGAHDRQQAAAMGITLHYRAGFFGTIVAYLGIFMGGVVMIAGSFLADDVPRALREIWEGMWPPHSLMEPPQRSASRAQRRARPALSSTPPQVADDAPDTSGDAGPHVVLRFRRGPWAGREVQTSGENILLGRGSGCDVRIPDRLVSRQHARLRYAQGQWFIQDQNSTGGTYVNDERVGATRLHPGDRVRLGQETEFVFRA